MLVRPTEKVSRKRATRGKSESGALMYVYIDIIYNLYLYQLTYIHIYTALI